MLIKIWNLLKNTFDLLVTIGKFALSLVQDLVKVVDLLSDTFSQLPSYLSVFFPGALVTVFVALLSIAVIYKVIGREG